MGIISDIGIIHANVMHHRLKPKVNKFLYSVYYLCLPLKMLNERKGDWVFGTNRLSILSFYAADHGDGDVSLWDWLKGILDKSDVKGANLESVELITMPRILGYVFNPISFWIVPNDQGEMLAVICEVNNTFGERHIYICAKGDGEIICPSDVLEAKKIFHVSPFLPRNGSYRFKFSYKDRFFSALVDYLDDDNLPMLLTSVAGTRQQASVGKLLHLFFAYPLMTLKVIFLIHWQALVILLKGIKYVPKPQQLEIKYSITETNKSN